MSLDDVLADFQTSTEELATSSATRVLAVYQRMVDGELTQPDAVLQIAGIINRTNATAVSLADVYLVAQIETATDAPTLSTGISPVDDSARLVKAVDTVLSEPPKTKMTRAEIRQALTEFGLDPTDWDIAAATKITNYSITESIRELAGLADDATPADRIAVHDEYGRLMGVDFLERIVDETESAAGPEVWAKLQAGDYDGLPAVWEYAPADAAMRLERLARAEPFEAAQQATTEAMQRHNLVEGWTRQMDANPCQLCKWWWREGRVWPKVHPFQRHKGCNCQPRVVVKRHIDSTGFSRNYERNQAS